MILVLVLALCLTLFTKRLNLEELKPTNMCLSMANKSITYPLSILENMPTKVGKFVIPVDFVVLEMEEDLEIPIFFWKTIFDDSRSNH